MGAVDLPALLGKTAPLDPPTTVVVLIIAAAAGLSIPRATWQFFGLFTTLVHELGHAFAALLTGRIVTGIQIHRNHAGSARSMGRGVLSGAISGFFGYPTPAIVGSALVWCVFNGYTALALLAGTIIIALTVLFVRNAFGILVVIGSAAVSGSLWYFADPTLQGYALLTLGAALLVGSVRAFFSVVAVHTSRRSELQTSDAWLLYSRTGIPSPVWLVLFAAVIAAGISTAVGSFAATLSLTPPQNFRITMIRKHQDLRP